MRNWRLVTHKMANITILHHKRRTCVTYAEGRASQIHINHAENFRSLTQFAIKNISQKNGDI